MEQSKKCEYRIQTFTSYSISVFNFHRIYFELLFGHMDKNNGMGIFSHAGVTFI